MNIKLLRSLALAGFCGLFIWFFSPVGSIDRVWNDILFACQLHPFPQEIVVVTITPQDVIAHGNERLSRRYIAETLSLLDRCKVRRVLFDLNLGSAITEDEEKDLVQAMRRLGAERLAVPLEPNSLLRTKESLLQEATQVCITLTPDSDGRMRFVSASSKPLAPNPCAWLAHGVKTFGTTSVDLRSDVSQINRVSLGDLHSGKITPSELENKLVVIALDRQITRSRTTLPVYGIVDRGTILALGTASCLRGFDANALADEWWLHLSFGVFLASGFWIGLCSLNVKRALLGSWGLILIVLALCWIMTFKLGIASRPASTLFGSLAAMKIAIAYRLRVMELFSGLLSGVLSPEEVWLWRVHADTDKPVVLLDAMGRVKKSNQAAVRHFGLSNRGGGKEVAALVRKIMPGLGERSERLNDVEISRNVWDIQWPSDHVPLAVFDDITQQYKELQQLEENLCRDSLTGELNRKGFDKALRDIEERGTQDYAIYFMDMNGFKGVNDRYGHAAGDILLQVAAKRFRNLLTDKDHLARLGGDEFGIIIERALIESEALRVRDQIEASLNEKIDVGEAIVKVGVAAGFALPQSSSDNAVEMVKRADLEMYQRKAWLKQKSGALGSERDAVPISSAISPTVSQATVCS